MYRFKKILTLLFIVWVAFLFERCNSSSVNKTNRIQLTLEKSILINDDKGLIRNTPHIITSTSDNRLNLLITPNKLLQFDILTNKLSALFDTIKFNIDSLIEKTYMVTNEKKYKYLKHTAKDLKNYDHVLYSLSPVSYENGNYYIPIAIKAKAENIEENSIKNKDVKKTIDSVKIKYGGYTIVSLENLNFIIIADSSYHQQAIFPYIPHTEDGFVKPKKGSFMFNKQLYIPMISSDILFNSDSITIKGMEPNFFFRVFTLSEKGITGSKSIIDKKLINSNLYSLSKHLSYKASYRVNNNELIVSLGKDFLNLTTNSLYKTQPILEENEFVSNFCFSGDYIIYTTEKFEREKNITHEHGFFTTLNQNFVKVIDIKTNELVFTRELDAKGIYTISPSNSIYEYIENKDSLNIKKFNMRFNE